MTLAVALTELNSIRASICQSREYIYTFSAVALSRDGRGERDRSAVDYTEGEGIYLAQNIYR